MDTTSNTLARILLCLAEHSTVQQRLRSELIDAFHEGDLDFNQLTGLPYLNAVCRETLRLLVFPIHSDTPLLSAHIAEHLDTLISSGLVECAHALCISMSMRAYETAVSATRDTVLPLSRPVHGTDGKLITELAVTAGTEVFTGILGCNTSKELWGEDALEWKPDRWLAPLPDSITKSGMPGLVGPL